MRLSAILAAAFSGLSLAIPQKIKTATSTNMHPQTFHLADGTSIELLMAGTFQPTTGDSSSLSTASRGASNDGMHFHPTPDSIRDDCREHSYMPYPDAPPAPRQDCKALRRAWADCTDCHGYWLVEGAVAMPHKGRFYELVRLGDCTLGIRSDKGKSEKWYVGDQDVVEALGDAMDLAVPEGNELAATGTMHCHNVRSGSPLPVSWAVYKG